MSRRNALTILTALMALGAAPTAPAQTPPTYTVTDLGVVPGSYWCDAKTVNNRGEVIGHIKPNAMQYSGSFYWRSGLGMVAIPPLVAGATVNATQINSAGEVLCTGGGYYVWKQGVGSTPLPGFPGSPAPAAFAINNADPAKGQTPMVVGYGQNALVPPVGTTPMTWGIAWTKDSSGRYTVVNALPPLPGDNYSSAYAANVNGVVVGYSCLLYLDASGNLVWQVPKSAVRWDRDPVTGEYVPTRLTSPNAAPPGAVQFPAWFVNSAGDVAGTMFTSAGGILGGFYTSADGTSSFPVNLPLPNNAAHVGGLNDSAQMAGVSRTAESISNGQMAFYWDPSWGSSALALGALGGSQSATTTEVRGTVINSAGYVVGWANTAPDRKGNQGVTAFVWIPAQSVPPVTGGQMYDLNKLTPTKGVFTSLSYAWGINDAGQICGSGPTTVKVQGVLQTHAFLLTPR